VARHCSVTQESLHDVCTSLRLQFCESSPCSGTAVTVRAALKGSTPEGVCDESLHEVLAEEFEDHAALSICDVGESRRGIEK
jgi:hypothetical protein